MNFCKETSTEKDVIIKTLPISMTLNRLKDLGKRLFGLGNKQLEFSYLIKEVNLNCSKIKTIYYFHILYFHLLLYPPPPSHLSILTLAILYSVYVFGFSLKLFPSILISIATLTVSITYLHNIL